jgi:hypothetical protein
MPKDEQQLVAMLTAVDRQLRAVLEQIEVVTGVLRENLCRLERDVSQLEPAVQS